MNVASEESSPTKPNAETSNLLRNNNKEKQQQQQNIDLDMLNEKAQKNQLNKKAESSSHVDLSQSVNLNVVTEHDEDVDDLLKIAHGEGKNTKGNQIHFDERGDINDRANFDLKDSI